jgi:hypothetical protein
MKSNLTTPERVRLEDQDTRPVDLQATRPIDLQTTRPSGVGLPYRSGPWAETRAVAFEAESWGWLPVLSLVVATGLLVVSSAYLYSRAGEAGSLVLFWLGVLLIVLPIAARLASASASRRERIGLVGLLGVGLYLVKVLHSPAAFTFQDELIHLRSAQDMLQYQRLFLPNYTLQVVAYFPGLESAVSALGSLTGLSAFAAGTMVIGAARLVLMLSLFFLFEQISGSARIAGLGALFYTASANFLFWSIQFSYESLALPIAAMAVFAAISRQLVTSHARHIALTLLALLAISSVVVTHHLTSYALASFLILVSTLYSLNAARYRRNQANLWGLAMFNVVAAVTWLVYVATLVIGYLTPIFGEAFQSLVQMILGEQGGRELFRSSAGQIAPLWERAIGISSVLLLLSGLPFGLYYVWKRARENAPALVLALACLTYFAFLALRFVPGAWEIANRASDFLFVGVAFMLAVAAGVYWIPVGSGRPRLVLFVVYVAIIFMGGVIAGWPPDLRLAQPYRIRAGEAIIEPVGVTAARWSRQYLGPDQPVIAPESDSLLMLAYGEQRSPPSRGRGLNDLFFSPDFGSGEIDDLNAIRPRYVVFDRRLISWDNMRGLYFQRLPEDAPSGDRYLEARVFSKLDRVEGVSRLLDAGDLLIFDVGALVTDEPE